MTNEELIKALRNRRVCLQATGSLDDHGLLAEAATAIESAMKSAQEAWRYASDNIPKWIPVSEKLPEEREDGFSEDVLMLVESPDGDRVWRDMFVGYYLYDAVSEETGWWTMMTCDCAKVGVHTHGGKQYEHNEYVTHWMPLPQPPRYCASCLHYLGGGDFNLCCDLKYNLCYKHTPACEKYEEKTDETV